MKRNFLKNFRKNGNPKKKFRFIAEKSQKKIWILTRWLFKYIKENYKLFKSLKNEKKGELHLLLIFHELVYSPVFKYINKNSILIINYLILVKFNK